MFEVEFKEKEKGENQFSKKLLVKPVNNPSQVLTDYGRGLKKPLKQSVMMQESY